MIVWGGYIGGWSATSYTNTGGIYDPAANSWTAMSTTGAPAGRATHRAVWTGSKMIVWGGYDGYSSQYFSSGGYDPSIDTDADRHPGHRGRVLRALTARR
jgi:N-acetylneuraminic acid mutarotase